MAIRMTGLNSGLDTDSIVQALMEAQRGKQTKVKNKLTKSEWTQDIWKDLNKKIYSFYTGELTKFKTQGSYLSKKVSSSNEGIATATATNSAANGSHTLEVNKLASSQSVTSGKVDASTTSTTLKSLGVQEGTEIEIANKNGKSQTLKVTDKTTIADFVSACKKADLNASYDTKQKRFFISAKSSGEKSGFSITTQTGGLTKKEEKLDLFGSNVAKDMLTGDIATLKSADIEKLKNLAGLPGAPLGTEDSDLLEAYDRLEEAMGVSAVDGTTIDTYLQEYIRQLEDKNSNVEGADPDVAWEAFETAANAAETSSVYTDIQASVDNYMGLLKSASPDEIAALLDKEVTDENGNTVTVPLSMELRNAYDYMCDYVKDADSFGKALEDYVTTKKFVDDSNGVDQLTFLGLQNLTTDMASGTHGEMSVIQASDAEIVLDGAILTGASNNFTVNGLDISLKNVTNGAQITLNTSTDTDAVYDVAKNFVKKYNEILDELNEKYNAKTSKGYDPLTDEQKEAMSEDEVEKWETKIKDSLLRRDGTLNSIISTMRTSLLTTTKVDGKAYTLASFGISTSSDYTEKGKLHIMGDPDDEIYSDKTNKLKEAIEANPDAVMKTLSEAGQALYENLTKKMAKTSLSSALTFYNDKQIESQQTAYKKQISEMETKLTDLEDRYYKQFTAMEKAMAKMQSQSNYLTSMLGGGA